MMTFNKILRRFFIPSTYISLHYYLKYRAKISLKAEVEFSPNLRMGKNSVISSFVKLKTSEGILNIGKNVSISNGSNLLAGEKGLKIEDNVMIGPNVIIVSSNYNYDQINTPIRLQGSSSKGIVIGENVWIGGGSVILDGATIGSGSIINANSVVSSIIPENSIVQGNPGRVIFTRR